MKALILRSHRTPGVVDLISPAGRLTRVDRLARHEPWTRGNR